MSKKNRGGKTKTAEQTKKKEEGEGEGKGKGKEKGGEEKKRRGKEAISEGAGKKPRSDLEAAIANFHGETVCRVMADPKIR